MRIDSHQHFWKYSKESYDWIDDSMSMLKRDYLPSNLQPLLNAHQFNGCIAVQARSTLVETDWLLSLAEEHSFIKGVVAWLDLKSQNLKTQLEHYRQQAHLVGLREILQSEEPSYMLTESFINGLKCLADADLAYDLLVYPRHLPAVKKLLTRLPQQRFVIDHLAKPPIARNEFQPWADDLKDISKHKHVFVKLSGLVTEASDSWQESHFTEYLQHVFDSFGEDRILFGSDWPVCSLKAEYEQVVQLCLNFVQNYSTSAEQKVFGGNAIKFYQLENTGS